ncbi:MAG: Arm DNA-binding domain-containing protein [Actinomycetota bacterium]|nr:Arm DNA-binding domain-containing protein [Actinomycetota bacterium]
MARKAEGVYADGQGGWYFKVTLGKDPLTGRRVQVTKRGFRSAAEAGRARRELGRADAGLVTSTPAALTVTSCSTCTSTGSTPTPSCRRRRGSTTASRPTATSGLGWAPARCETSRPK